MEEKLFLSAQLFFENLCHYVGEDSKREGLCNTSKRIAHSYSNLLDGYGKSPKAALGSAFVDGLCDEMIVLKKLRFYSLCEHHLLPFFGEISVGYVPGERIVGISGIARLVEVFAHRLQIQERLTAQIADSLMEELEAKGVMVLCEARHLCLEMREQGQSGEISTSALRGLFKRDSKTRAEFMQILKK